MSSRRMLKHKNQPHKSSSNRKIAVLCVVAAVFALAGLWFLVGSRAATNVSSVEAEDGVPDGAAIKIDSSDASGKRAVHFGSTSPNPTPTPNPNPTPAYPAAVLDLKLWKLTLPVKGSGSGPLEILQPALATYKHDSYFYLNAVKNGVIFRVNHGGHTTSGSSNPRTELREMAGDGTKQASWSSTSGTHKMTIKQKINRLTKVKPHVVVGQIHDANDDVTVFRLEGKSLWITDGNTAHGRLLTDNYQLGTIFTVGFEVSGGVVKYYYNDQLVPYSQKKSFSGAYFKAGNYLQSNPLTAPSESTSEYSEVEILDVQVAHS